ncbi:type-F conjugative transfer system pilin chaperone TraQ, partial [Escherichia coli]|nr:type-F conjugative transfer system pilin chaperone TraQ [Escherichia coli]
ADRNRSHWSTSKTPSYTKSVSWHHHPRLVYSKPWMAFFLAELIAAILVLFGAYQVLDAWIARVSREEREALEARQQAMMEGQQEGGHVSH